MTNAKLTLLVLFLTVSVARSDPPAVSFLFPAGGQRGTSVELQVGGLALNESCRAEVLGEGVKLAPILKKISVPWFEGPLLPLPESQRQEAYPQTLTGKLEIDRDAKPGVRFVRCWTSQGVSFISRFIVGELPEIMEKEEDGNQTHLVPLNHTINGRIYPREEIDTWQVDLKAGQTLFATIDAASFDSQLEARLELRDSANRLLVEARSNHRDDPAFEFTAPREGSYSVRVFDRAFDGSQQHVYRLTLSTKKPEPRNLSLPTQQPLIRESDEPTDPVKGNHLLVPSTGSGTISKPGESDRWSFSARKGETLEAELFARRLDSPVLGLLAIQDANGKELATAETANLADPTLKFTVPVDGLYFLRVADRFRTRGGEKHHYRVQLRKPLPSFSLALTNPSFILRRGTQDSTRINVSRFGNFNGPIHLTVEGLPRGVSLAKETIINPGQNQIELFLKADASAKIDTSLITIRGTGWVRPSPIDSVLIPIQAEAIFQENLDDPAVNRVRLAVALPTPFKIVGDYSLKLIPRGTTYTRHYRIDRNGFTGPIEITLADRQARHLQGVSGPKIIVPEGVSEFDYPIVLPPWMEIGRTCRVCVLGTAKVKEADGSEHVVTYSSTEQNDQIIAVIEPERLGLEVEQTTLRGIPGSEIRLPFKVSRGTGIRGPARIELIDAPSGVQATAVDLPAETDRGEIRLRLTESFKGSKSVLLRSSVPDGKYPVVAEVKLEVWSEGK
jgi:hypothetical protein